VCSVIDEPDVSERFDVVCERNDGYTVKIRAWFRLIAAIDWLR